MVSGLDAHHKPRIRQLDDRPDAVEVEVAVAVADAVDVAEALVVGDPEGVGVAVAVAVAVAVGVGDPVEVGVGDGEITRASDIQVPQFGVASGVGCEAEYSAATQTAV